MALWLVRANRQGDVERRFFVRGRVYLPWTGLDWDLRAPGDKVELRRALEQVYPEAPPGRIRNHLGQIWAFSHGIEEQDWIVLPGKLDPVIHLGQVTRGYAFEPQAEDPYQHSLGVGWLARDVPRADLPEDILQSLTAPMQVCRIQRTGAEQQIRAIAEGRREKRSSKVAIPAATPARQHRAPAVQARTPLPGLAKSVLRKVTGHEPETVLQRLIIALVASTAALLAWIAAVLSIAHAGHP